jgi:hypothetical protein
MKSDAELDQIFATVSAPADEGRTLRKDEFDGIFAESVYEGLRWTSGLVANILRSFLQDAMTYETGWGKSKRSIKDAATLEKGLERIFGFGAKVFEKKILEILYEKLQLNEHSQQLGHDFKFSKEVKRAKKLFNSKIRSGERSIDEQCKPKGRT